MRNVNLANPKDARSVHSGVEITGCVPHLGVLVTRGETGPSRVKVI